MKTHPLTSIDSQVLYRQSQPLDGEKLFSFITEAAKAVGTAEEDCELIEVTEELDVRARCADYQVQVTQSVPFAEDDYLKIALDTFSFETSLKSVPEIDDTITACIHVSVQKRAMGEEDAPGRSSNLADAQIAAFSGSSETLSAMALAKDVVARIVQNTQPASAFWGPSVFLVEPEKFLELASAKNPLSLYLHCHVYSHYSPDAGKRLFGVIASGAQWLIGRNVEFKPSPLPPQYLVEKVYDFVRFTLKNDGLLSESDVFGRDENERIRPIMHRSSGSGPDSVELKVIYNPEFGITHDTSLRFDDLETTGLGSFDDPHLEDEDTDLNPNDPVDAAILERLAELNKDAPSPSSDHSAEVDAQAAPDVPAPDALAPEATAPEATAPEATAPAVSEPTVPEPATVAPEATPAPDMAPAPEPVQRPRTVQPQAQKMSMAELRDFAKEAQVPLAAIEDRPKKRGLLGKFFKKKSG